jgi:hypothetical protein
MVEYAFTRRKKSDMFVVRIGILVRREWGWVGSQETDIPIRTANMTGIINC